MNEQAALDRNPLRGAITFSLLQQLAMVLLASLMLDGGRLLKLTAIAAVVFQVLMVFLMIRQRPAESETHQRIIKWGFWPLLLLTWAIGFVWYGIWP